MDALSLDTLRKEGQHEDYICPTLFQTQKGGARERGGRGKTNHHVIIKINTPRLELAVSKIP